MSSDVPRRRQQNCRVDASPQIARKLVRVPVQLQVCQDVRAERYRHTGVRRLGCLLFKELMKGPIFPILVHLKVGTLRPGYVSLSKVFFQIVPIPKWILSRNAKSLKK